MIRNTFFLHCNRVIAQPFVVVVAMDKSRQIGLRPCYNDIITHKENFIHIMIKLYFLLATVDRLISNNDSEGKRKRKKTETESVRVRATAIDSKLTLFFEKIYFLHFE